MSIANYTELKSLVADFLNRADLTSVIPTFIKLAEARFNRDLRVRQMIKRAEATTDSGESAITLPGDWLESRVVRAVVNGQLVVLEHVTLEQADDFMRGRGYTGGQPERFNITGDQLTIYPTPPTGTEIQMTYYGKIPALTDANASNWLLLEWPDMYLYGTLAHSAPYLKDDERVATWAAFYDRALDEIRLANERAQHSSFGLKMRARKL